MKSLTLGVLCQEQESSQTLEADSAACVEGSELLYGVRNLSDNVYRSFSTERADGVLYYYGYSDTTKRQEHVAMDRQPGRAPGYVKKSTTSSAVITIGEEKS